MRPPRNTFARKASYWKAKSFHDSTAFKQHSWKLSSAAATFLPNTAGSTLFVVPSCKGRQMDRATSTSRECRQRQPRRDSAGVNHNCQRALKAALKIYRRISTVSSGSEYHHERHRDRGTCAPACRQGKRGATALYRPARA